MIEHPDVHQHESFFQAQDSCLSKSEMFQLIQWRPQTVVNRYVVTWLAGGLNHHALARRIQHDTLIKAHSRTGIDHRYIDLAVLEFMVEGV